MSIKPFTNTNPNLRDPAPKAATVRLGELKRALDLSAVQVRIFAGADVEDLDTGRGAAPARTFARHLSIPFPRPVSFNPPLWDRETLIFYRRRLATMRPEDRSPQDDALLARMRTQVWTNLIHGPAQFSGKQRQHIAERNWKGVY